VHLIIKITSNALTLHYVELFSTVVFVWLRWSYVVVAVAFSVRWTFCSCKQFAAGCAKNTDPCHAQQYMSYNW